VPPPTRPADGRIGTVDAAEAFGEGTDERREREEVVGAVPLPPFPGHPAEEGERRRRPRPGDPPDPEPGPPPTESEAEPAPNDPVPTDDTAEWQVPDGHVPVVRVRDGDDDFASWDSADSSWFEPEPVGPQQDDQDPAETVWYPTWRPAGPGEQVSAAQTTLEPDLRCGGPILSDEEMERIWTERQRERQQAQEPEWGDGQPDDEEEPAGRTAADLIERDRQAWGGRAHSTGVLE
jgi:hypothetical protein